MRQRNNPPPGAIKRSAVPPRANTPAVEDDELTVRVPSRNAAPFRSKRPPPLPNRKAHKIKRIKAQRSAAWAALDPERNSRSAQSQRGPNAAATTVVRHEGVLIEAERERAEALRRKREQAQPNAKVVQHLAARRQAAARLPAEPAAVPAPAAGKPAADTSAQRPDGRWLLLLKVGRDELAGIWDGSLASCEPIVWRPATKSWAPLFEVPQIATLVSASVKQRQAAARAAAVPASPAPRRRKPSRVQPSERPRASVPPPERAHFGSDAGAVSRSAHPVAAGRASAGSLAVPSGHALRPSSLDEIGAHTVSGAPTARLALRSPYIPPPPRVPNMSVHAQTAFAGDAYEPELAPEPERYAQARETIRSEAPSTPAVDSVAPQARTLAPLGGSSGQTSVYERARWLMTGVAAALLLTTFTGAGTSLREGLVSLIDPEPGGALGSALGMEARESVGAEPSKPERSAAESAPARPATGDEKKGDRRTLSVEELPVLGTREEAEASADDEPAKKAQDARSKQSKSAAVGRKSATARPARPSAMVRSPQRSGGPATRANRPVAGAGFDAGQARRALATSVARAQFCAAERATGTVVVTFAPTGGVQGVSLASLSGDDVRKGCVVRAFRGARVSPFQGDAVTVQKSFRLR